MESKGSVSGKKPTCGKKWKLRDDSSAVALRAARGRAARKPSTSAELSPGSVGGDCPKVSHATRAHCRRKASTYGWRGRRNVLPAAAAQPCLRVSSA